MIPKPEPRPKKARKPLKRGKRTRRERYSSRAKLGRECDRLWSLIVRRRGACEVCGAREFLQGAHGFSRRYRGTRWELMNGFCLDRKCHVRYTHDPLAWDDYIRTSWGQLVYDNLKEQAQKVSGSELDLAAIHAELTAVWEARL